MTLRELIERGIEIEGYRKIQCWETEDNPTIYHEGYDFHPSLEQYMDWEVRYMFPYMVSICEAGVCIELIEPDVE